MNTKSYSTTRKVINGVGLGIIIWLTITQLVPIHTNGLAQELFKIFLYGIVVILTLFVVPTFFNETLGSLFSKDKEEK